MAVTFITKRKSYVPAYIEKKNKRTWYEGPSVKTPIRKNINNIIILV